jgi:hypothetical protein
MCFPSKLSSLKLYYGLVFEGRANKKEEEGENERRQLGGHKSLFQLGKGKKSLIKTHNRSFRQVSGGLLLFSPRVLNTFT